MPPKNNPLKLNKLQLRTLALAQVLAREPGLSTTDSGNGDVTINHIPRPHGDHVHVGPFVVAARDASGFANPSVWVALHRKGLIRDADNFSVTLTPEGVNYETGLSDRFVSPSDH